MSSTAHLRPRWMLLGVDMAPDGVTIWFSDTPIDTEVRSVMRQPQPFEPSGVLPRAEIDHVVFSTRVRSYKWVKGATYEEALRRLFDQWTPTAAEHPAVSPQPALPEFT